MWPRHGAALRATASTAPQHRFNSPWSRLKTSLATDLVEGYPVTVYDRDLRPGGHSHTVTIDYDGTPLAVDIGFIVYNELNYPDLTALFAHLGIVTTESCMSFAVTADAGRVKLRILEIDCESPCSPQPSSAAAAA